MKRRIIKFVSVAVFIDFVLDILCNLLRINIPLFSQSVSSSNALGLLTSCITLILCFVLGYNLNKDKTSAVVFSGMLYFAGYIPNFISVLIGILLSYFSLIEGMASLIAVAEFLLGVVLLPLEIFICVYAYTAFIGINDKLPGEGSADFTMSLSRARKRFIVATVVETIAVSLIMSIPVIFTLLPMEVISGFTLRIFSLISSVVTFFIIYYAGYKPGKNHTEAMSFFGAYALGGGISTVISSLFSVAITPIISGLITRVTWDEVTQNVLNGVFSVIDVDIFSLAASSPILLILSVVVTLYILRFFFEKKDEEFYVQ